LIAGFALFLRFFFIEMPETILSKTVLDCAKLTTREINQQLKALAAEGIEQVEVVNPAGRHNLAIALEHPITIRFKGSVGYYCGGLCDGATIEINGSCGWSVGENLMSGQITVQGNASANAGASAHGGKICVLGNAGSRAAISLKGATLIVSGNVGHSSAFMMQQGRFIICGDAGENLGDSIYDGEIFVGGTIKSLGADARLEPMSAQDWEMLTQELHPLSLDAKAYEFKKIVCAQELYHFKAKDFSKWKDAY
jgi:glutamate synthase domain-containing protein 3